MQNNETTQTKWQGKSKGNIIGYKIFVLIIKRLGVRAAYVLLFFVAFYYFVFEWRSNRYMYDYFRNRLGFSRIKSVGALYQNYFTFGQTIIDKVAILSGAGKQFTFEFDGVHHLQQLLEAKKGGVLISAHIGNFEIADHFFAQIDINCQINIVTTDLERSAIKKYLESITTEKKSPDSFILVKEDMSHIFEISNALAKNEIICFTGDRYFQGTKHLTADFLGRQATFPAGPFVIASRMRVPVIFVYVMKEKNLHYHLYARTIQAQPRDVQGLLHAYVKNMEEMVQKYPLQWFNYFDFWEKTQ
ncbi:lipid A biosynthesis acyltransferase [Capnocytophaga sp.]|uniref:LpxL/LpxP family acyltransferase n=1 Tax=Capnocytophaga sp. TaxID=44737 RepID=UPI0026DD9AC8|nr:lipid A biosynthesis acyltransferase [Capnocytophaga sp.]MDO5106248.1 lipid A biosynthesis acyltransferase [Capnocytophaga sp.]